MRKILGTVSGAVIVSCLALSASGAPAAAQDDSRSLLAAARACFTGTAQEQDACIERQMARLATCRGSFEQRLQCLEGKILKKPGATAALRRQLKELVAAHAKTLGAAKAR